MERIGPPRHLGHGRSYVGLRSAAGRSDARHSRRWSGHGLGFRRLRRGRPHRQGEEPGARGFETRGHDIRRHAGAGDALRASLRRYAADRARAGHCGIEAQGSAFRHRAPRAFGSLSRHGHGQGAHRAGQMVGPARVRRQGTEDGAWAALAAAPHRRGEYADGWDLKEVPINRGYPDDVVVAMNLDAHSAVVAVTHDPKLDDAALLEALKSPAFYVGALGSQKNNDARRKRLADFDLAASEIARLRGPVGLKIGSKTPPEIAAAILAEMTAVRRGVQIPETVEPPKVNVSAGCEVPQN